MDTKPHDVEDVYRTIPAGDPFHRMRVVMTVDSDFVIRNLSAFTDAAPTPYCAGITTAYAALEGVKVGPGFRNVVAERLGGDKGCTHLTELLGPMATTLYQSTMHMWVEAQRQRVESDASYEPPTPFVIGSCHGYRTDGEPARRLQQRWGEWRGGAMTAAPDDSQPR
ncbi:hypothetical protein D3C78_1247260 [compost metagenome]